MHYKMNTELEESAEMVQTLLSKLYEMKCSQMPLKRLLTPFSLSLSVSVNMNDFLVFPAS